MSFYCAKHGPTHDACDECLAKAIELLKAFIACEQFYQSMLNWDETETYREAQAFIQQNVEPPTCKECGFHHPGGTCLDS